jgi:hypothetical protein
VSRDLDVSSLDTFNYELYHSDGERFKKDFERHKDSMDRASVETNYLDLSRTTNLVEVLEPFASDDYFSTEDYSLILECRGKGGTEPSALFYESSIHALRAFLCKCEGSTLGEKMDSASQRIYDRVKPSRTARIRRRLHL